MSVFARDYAHIESEKVKIKRKKFDAKIKKDESVVGKLKINDL